MEISRISIINSKKTLEWLSNLEVSIPIALKILKIIDFYEKVKNEIDEYSKKIYNENKDLEDVAKEISSFMQQCVNVENVLDINELHKEGIKISANKLRDLSLFV
jgi:predicted  nucleic acid-binding Zn-ribbon protein